MQILFQNISIVKSVHDTHSFPTPWRVKLPNHDWTTTVFDCNNCTFWVEFFMWCSPGHYFTIRAEKIEFWFVGSNKILLKIHWLFKHFLGKLRPLSSNNLVHEWLFTSNSSKFVCSFSNCISVPWNSLFILDLQSLPWKLIFVARAWIYIE